MRKLYSKVKVHWLLILLFSLGLSVILLLLNIGLISFARKVISVSYRTSYSGINSETTEFFQAKDLSSLSLNSNFVLTTLSVFFGLVFFGLLLTKNKWGRLLTERISSHRNIRIKNLKFHRYLHWFMLGLTILTLGIGVSLEFKQKSKLSSAATYSKTWTSYNDFNYKKDGAGATSTQSAVVLAGAADPDSAASGSIILTTATSSVAQTTDTDFNSGTFNQATVSATGSPTNVEVSTVAADSLATTSAVLPTARRFLSCAENSLTFKIYCFGGNDASGNLNQIAEYTPSTDTMATKSATLPSARNFLSCAENSSTNLIYCFGGSNDGNQIVEYDSSSDSATLKSATLPTARYGLSCAENSATHKIYCFGGNSGTLLDQIVEYDTTDDSISIKTATLPTGRYKPSCVEDAITNRIYCAGGWDSGGYVNQIVEYIPATDALNIKSATFPSGIGYHSCSKNSKINKIYCFGGDGGGNQIFEYDPATDVRTTKTATLPTARRRLSCAENSLTFKIYCFGGETTSGSVALDQITQYTSSLFNSSGDFTSSSLDLGQISSVSTLDFTISEPDNTNLQFQLRSATSSGALSSATWYGPTSDSDYYTSSGTAINVIHNGDQFFQYKAYFTTTDTVYTATLSNITLIYTPMLGTVSNLILNTPLTPTWANISWTAATPAGTLVKFRVRVASSEADLASASWSAYLTTSGSSLNDLAENQWLELETTLQTEAIPTTPTLNDVTVTYVQNTLPVVATSSATLASNGSGLVSVGYQLSDSEEGACTDLESCQGVDDGLVSLSLEYSTDSANWSTASAVTQTGMTVNSGVISVTSVHQAATGYTLNWDAKTDLGTSIDYQTYYLRLRADDGNAARNLTTSGEVSLTIDTASPASPTISISASPSATVEGIKRTSSTSVNLDLSATDNDNSKYMMIKINDETFADSSWESYAATKSAYSLDISSTEKTNIIYVKFKDSSGNETSLVTDTVVYDTSPPVAPVNLKIADISDAINADYRLVISWSRVENPTSNDFSSYQIYRSTTSNLDGSLVTTVNNRTTTYHIDQSLIQNQIYYYKLKSTDSLGNTSSFSSVISATPSVGDITPVTLSSGTTVSISTTSTTATFTFYTTDVSYGYVDYGTNNSLTKTIGELEAVSSQNPHSVILTGLSSGTTYLYRVRAKSVANFEGKIKESTVEEGQTFTTSSEATISNVQVLNLSTSSATIIWQTSELANGEVSYGTTTALGSTQAQALSDSSTNHSAFLTGLTPGVTYYYRVKSGSSSYPELSSSPSSFETTPTVQSTTPPSISGEGPSVTTLSTSVTVTWTTDKVSDSFVEYGLTFTYGTLTGLDNSTLSHSVTLTGLAPSTAYHFRVKSKDSDGNTGVSLDSTFTTKDKSVITEVTITDITLNSAILSWTTNVISSSKVKVGTKINSFDQEISEESTDKTLNHVARISNLAEGTKYYLRIDGVDGDGGKITSDDYPFTTIFLPKIGNVKVKGTDAHATTITWQTNVESDSTISYGLSGSQLNTDRGKPNLTTSHEIKLTNLDDTTKYFFKVKSRDVSGNLAESEVSSFTTTADLLPPAISEIKSEASVIGGGESARIQIIVSWSTDEPATSMVEYDEGVGLGSNVYSFQTNEDKTLNQSHIVIVSGLKPSTSYRFRVKSTDKIGNSSNSTENTILTPPQEISILQLILKSWEETFAWTGNLKRVIPYWPF